MNVLYAVLGLAAMAAAMLLTELITLRVNRAVRAYDRRKLMEVMVPEIQDGKIARIHTAFGSHWIIVLDFKKGKGWRMFKYPSGKVGYATEDQFSWLCGSCNKLMQEHANNEKCVFEPTHFRHYLVRADLMGRDKGLQFGSISQVINRPKLPERPW